MTSPTTYRPVDPHELELLGKQAALAFETAGIGLNDAVLQAIGHVKLNAEQVRRVVETANIEAFNRKFAALSGTTRAVHIDGGPADPVHVMTMLKEAGRPREVIMDSIEYSMPPDLVKRSSESFSNFQDGTRKGAFGEVYGLRSKLSSAHAELVQGVEAAKERLSDRFVELAQLVKSASLEGALPEELYEAWSQIHPEMAGVIAEKLAGFMKASNTKVAGRGINPTSKVVTVFGDLVKESLSAEAHSIALRSLETQLVKVSEWLSHNGA